MSDDKPGDSPDSEDKTILRDDLDRAKSVRQNGPSDPDPTDDKTVIRGATAPNLDAPEDDRTVLREPAATSQGGPAGRVEDTVADSQDETILRGNAARPGTGSGTGPASDATVLRSGSELSPNPPAGNSNATLLRRGASGTAGNATILRQPGQAPDENATIIRTEPPSNPHATILRGRSSEDDATLLKNAATGDDATVMRSGDGPDDADATVMNTTHDNDATVMGTDRKADTTYVAKAPGPTQSRGNSEAGRLLKNRFVLEERVGSGGMGDVYKALDLRQQEAQERNPYIAIKILNENFARHKDAFMSLQREATRTRGIPHPNIMAVYDFDREGDTVFMSMELLDGKPLDDYLKDHPEGVSIDDAWNIIDGICQGLSRAHGAGIVHSDFKPGNIYYTGDKVAKVFDFGIARAVSSPGDLQADGEKTVFDAGSLGALTPTYASLEMLTGKEPTKADDVYAVALVAYELFTGRHPYNRTPADKALERGLEPEPIPFLKRRHWRALKKGLALKGEDRFQSVDEFYQGMFSEDPPVLRYVAIAAVLIASIGFGVYTAIYGGAEVPVYLTNLQGRLNADKNNLESRLGKLETPLNPATFRFESDDWRGEIRQSLGRVRAVDLELQEQFAEEWDLPPDPTIDLWKRRVLDAYLLEVAEIQQKVVTETDITVGNLEEKLSEAETALNNLRAAQLYLDEAREHFAFDQKSIADEAAKLAQALELREFQFKTINDDIEEAAAQALAAEERRIAEEQAAAARLEQELALEERNTIYLRQIDELKSILRCKGEIPMGKEPGQRDDLTRLGEILNGGGDIRIDTRVSAGLGDSQITRELTTVPNRGLRNTFPEQFEVDRPGIVAAIKGCIEQRIAVRDPDHAREVKARVMTYLPEASELASTVIEDLDPCALRTLEGRGNRNGSWCTDRLSVGGNGPELVVVPPKDGTLGKFAISRIEVKVSDYNRYCEATGCQKIDGPQTLPVTNISLAQAEDYTRWLSDQTGRTYRLPTTDEWLYAARTNTEEPLDDNINCTVDSRGVRLGDKLLSTLSGRPNRWGLYNFVGNAREWAIAGETVKAMGGAHTDPRSECSIDKQITHSGNPDPVTGFRIVRPIEG